MVNFKISFMFIYKAFNNISVYRQDSVRVCGDGASQVCRQVQAQCRPSRGGWGSETQSRTSGASGSRRRNMRTWTLRSVTTRRSLLPLSTSWSTQQVSGHCLCHNVLPILLLNVQLIMFVKSAGFLLAAAP